MGNLLGDTVDITSRSPLKTRRLDDSSIVTDVSAETVTFQYDDSGSLASATGEAAGTMIYAKLTYDGILNSFKDKIGDMNDSSFEFVTGNVLTTALTIDIEREVENWRRLTVTEKFTEMAKYMETNGQYWVDHADGTVWGIAAALVADDTANYSYKAPVQATGTSVATSVKITDGTDTADILARTTGTEVPADTDDALVVYDVGSGGSSSTLVATHTSPNDGTVAYTSNVTITCSGFPFTVDDDNCTVVYVLYKPSGGEWQSPLVQGAGGVSLTASSDVITVDGAGTPFASGDTYIVGIQYQDKAYNEAVNAEQNLQLNPDSETYAGETVAEATGEGDGTTYYYIDMAGYRKLALQIENTDGAAGNNTYTLKGTLQDDGTAADSCTYQDITQYGFTNLTGADAASYTADVMLASKEDNKALKYVSVKVVRAADGGNTDGAWTIHLKRLY